MVTGFHGKFCGERMGVLRYSPAAGLNAAMPGGPLCLTAVQISSAGVERNAIIGDDEVRRAQDIPIIQVGPVRERAAPWDWYVG